MVAGSGPLVWMVLKFLRLLVILLMLKLLLIMLILMLMLIMLLLMLIMLMILLILLIMLLLMLMLIMLMLLLILLLLMLVLLMLVLLNQVLLDMTVLLLVRLFSKLEEEHDARLSLSMMLLVLVRLLPRLRLDEVDAIIRHVYRIPFLRKPFHHGISVFNFFVVTKVLEIDHDLVPTVGMHGNAVFGFPLGQGAEEVAQLLQGHVDGVTRLEYAFRRAFILGVHCTKVIELTQQFGDRKLQRCAVGKKKGRLMVTAMLVSDCHLSKWDGCCVKKQRRKKAGANEVRKIPGVGWKKKSGQARSLV